MNQLEQLEEIKNNPELFEEKFNNLNQDYIFESREESYDFIKEHPGLLLLLEEYAIYLKKYFPYGIFELSVSIDPEIITWKTLILYVKLDKQTYENGSYELLTYMRRYYRPLRRKLNVMGEIVVISQTLR